MSPDVLRHVLWLCPLTVTMGLKDTRSKHGNCLYHRGGNDILGVLGPHPSSATPIFGNWAFEAFKGWQECGTTPWHGSRWSRQRVDVEEVEGPAAVVPSFPARVKKHTKNLMLNYPNLAPCGAKGPPTNETVRFVIPNISCSLHASYHNPYKYRFPFTPGIRGFCQFCTFSGRGFSKNWLFPEFFAISEHFGVYYFYGFYCDICQFF